MEHGRVDIQGPTSGIARFGGGRAFSALLLPVTMLFLTSGAVAPAEAVPPTPQACEQEDFGERLKCKQDNAIAQHEHMVGVFMEEGQLSGFLTEAQKKGLANGKERMRNAGNQVKPDNFKSLTKKREATCPIAELNGDGDGICEPGEDCEEVIGDQIGDDVQPCRPLKGKNKEACVEICGEDVTTEDEGNLDVGLAANLEGVYDDVTTQTMEANEILEEEAPLMSAMHDLAQAGASCELVTGGLTRVPFATFVALKTLAVTTRGVADIAERGCDQTVFGANGSTVCIAVETLASLAAQAWNAVEEIEVTLDSLTVDATLDCVDKLGDELSNVQAQVGEMQGDIDAVQTEIVAIQTQIESVQRQITESTNELRMLLNQTMDLLRTPQGIRPGFPEPSSTTP